MGSDASPSPPTTSVRIGSSSSWNASLPIRLNAQHTRMYVLVPTFQGLLDDTRLAFVFVLESANEPRHGRIQQETTAAAPALLDRENEQFGPVPHSPGYMAQSNRGAATWSPLAMSLQDQPHEEDVTHALGSRRRWLGTEWSMPEQTPQRPPISSTWAAPASFAAQAPAGSDSLHRIPELDPTSLGSSWTEPALSNTPFGGAFAEPTMGPYLRNEPLVHNTSWTHRPSQRRPSNRDEFDGPSEYLPKPHAAPLLEPREADMPQLPMNLLPEEQDRILTSVSQRLSQCAFDFVAKYQFPIPIEPDKRRVRVPNDREWSEWVYLLKRLATKRRIPTRVLYNGQIKQFTTVLESSLDMKPPSRHQSRPLKDDRNMLQLISAALQVAKILKDAAAMHDLDRHYVEAEWAIRSRVQAQQLPVSSTFATI